jgi:hypothetical protein
MSTYTDTFNRDDIRRVYASFAADYKIVAEWSGLHPSVWVETNIAAIRLFAEEQYVASLHMQQHRSDGSIRRAAVYRVTEKASLWSTDRPGDLYWNADDGDYLELIVYYSQTWWDLTLPQRNAFREKHNINWGTSDFDGKYSGMTANIDKHFGSHAYGMERTQYGS